MNLDTDPGAGTGTGWNAVVVRQGGNWQPGLLVLQHDEHAYVEYTAEDGSAQTGYFDERDIIHITKFMQDLP